MMGNSGAPAVANESAWLYSIAADFVLILHVLLVVFIVGGLVAVLVGKLRGWQWPMHVWFRLTHVAAIGTVVVQSWLGITCPLTVWEQGLRARAGTVTYQGDFIAHWLQQILFYTAPAWVFITVYTLFGGLVVWSWLWAPPRRPPGR